MPYVSKSNSAMRQKKIPGIISVRIDSSRLNKKCLLDFAGLSVLEHVIVRAQLGGIEPIVCTSNDKKDNPIVEIAKKLNIKYFRGPKANKILRWYLCCKKFNLTKIHTIDADDPFFDQHAIKKSFDMLYQKKCDLVLPSKTSRDGGASEGYSMTKNCLKKIINIGGRKMRSPHYDTEIIEGFIPDQKIKKYGTNYEIPKARLTLDYIEDYNFLKIIALKCGNFSSRKKINVFLKNNYNLLKINSKRSKDWMLKQKFFLESII